MGAITHNMQKGRILTVVVLTLVVGWLLVHVSPVSALTMDITEPSPKTLGEMITFSIKVNIHDSEIVPIQRVDLEIYNQETPDPYKLICTNLPLVAESKTYSTVGGTVEVEAIPEFSWGYGYGYRHAEWQGDEYVWGYGYGYGYQPGTGTTSITYNVAWNSLGTWPAGTYKINLIVIADGDSFVQSRTVDLLPIIAIATVDIDPDTLNIKSSGKWITAYIELPTGLNVEDIDGSSVMLNGSIPAHLGKEGWAKAEATDGNIMDHDGNGILERMVKFDRQAVAAILSPGEEVEITITGEVAGATFEAVDVIRVIDKGQASSKSSNANGKAKGKDDAPGQNKEPGDNANGKAKGKDDAPGQNKEPGDNANGKAKGKDDAPGQNKEPGDNANGKAKGKDDAPGQNKEPGDNANGKAKGKDDAPGQNKEPGDNANGKVKGKPFILNGALVQVLAHPSAKPGQFYFSLMPVVAGAS